MIDHVSLVASAYARSRAFYQAALPPLGYTLLMELPTAVTGGIPVGGFGVAPKPDFWISEGTPNRPILHIAFRAPNREAVQAFYAAALAAGGTDNGPPGPRPHYHPDYFGAFVSDPDGHNIEAVCHTPVG